MSPFCGRGGRGRGGDRGGRGGRGGSRGGAQNSGKLARSGIKTKNGYRKFDSQRVKEVESEDEQPQIAQEESESEQEEIDDEDEQVDLVKPTVKAYNALLQSFHKPGGNGERKAKRRKIEHVQEDQNDMEDDDEVRSDEDIAENEQVEQESAEDESDNEEAAPDTNDHGRQDDPYELHFASPDDNELSRRLESIQGGKWRSERQAVGRRTNLLISVPEAAREKSLLRPKFSGPKKAHLKERLAKNISHAEFEGEAAQTLAPYVFAYQDVLMSGRTPESAPSLRNISALHAVNHVLKGRDRVLKNNERLSHADSSAEINAQDQGFVRPKILILTETRQMAANYADAIVEVFKPDQQEHRKRFDDAFRDPLDDRQTMPEDYRELFGGNNDNSFLTALKLTRKTLKFYSGFYNSDIILASPLGLRRIIENEDKKKQDYDFLSSIEVLIADQADAMYMQNWENVEVVFNHLNLELRQAHDCDFSRVRPWYLDGHAKHLRQTILFSAYMTPEMNRLWSAHMLNVEGKVKYTPSYAGAITDTSGLGIKQTFSRFDSSSPGDDPDARFKYFTTAILPRLLRTGAQGTLIFIPSYFDFLRIRNFFAGSTLTEETSFGTIHDYSEVSDQRRARSRFSNGKHSILLYTQRAHHFFRLKIRDVKRVVMYGMPDNPIFYQELVEGYLGTSISEGKIEAAEANVRAIFSKWDGLRLERVVGSERVKSMLTGAGDTFDFV
ncbi:U3 small nucleolar RNA-associated protein 25 [Pseudocercospora fuligena]|uniref:U3 small nucleolar RNA-associated protein 25 n=1 Tax=Pseudocercospora fuligena TaxID=685502 RepID=A0A8H6R7F5_9PEZI|nr:U3 small nucleolar RNA-associated protein 25 [Pseudocercospora fuligena]